MSAEKILIVEDERALSQIVESYLKRLGYQVAGIVNNAAEALRMVAKARPDLALVDIEIQGGRDGIELAEQLRKQHDIPVIFLTGRADDETMERVRRSESFGYLLKPFHLSELKAGIELAFIRFGHEAHLKQIEQSFSAAIRSTGDAIVITNQAGAVSFLNPAAERLTGWLAGKAVGQPLETMFKIRGDSGPTKQWSRITPKVPSLHEAIMVTTAGRELPIEVTASTIHDEVRGTIGSVLVFRDITDRKRFEAQLQKSQGELRMLAGHLESAREAERTRIAREIHDEFGQLLAGFKFDLAWLERKLSAQPEVPRAALLEKVQAMTEFLPGMVQAVRRIAAELRPGVLDDLGLAAAVEWQSGEFQKRTGIKVLVRAALAERELPQEIKTALFRVFQESLTNVARHTEAKRVRVSLSESAGQILLEVEDDGRGITAADLSKTGTFGLLGMRERLTPLHGRCDIRGGPGQGTTVSITVPLGVDDPPKKKP
jgi:two-component system, NarL family, sensor histidine kinase UhpB